MQLDSSYYDEIQRNLKGAWEGKPLIDILQLAFPFRPKCVLQRSCDLGLVKVNGLICLDQMKVLKLGDVIALRVHRHEPRVMDGTLTKVHVIGHVRVNRDIEIVGVNKPASIPSHPCGR
jgi:23S rRNA-/tRNA-specific pseudouridylate synthase